MLTVEGVLRTAAQTALARRDRWNQLDARTGDGDIGTTLARGFGAVLESWDELDRSTPGSLLTEAALILARVMGGTSGPLWSVALLRAGAVAGGQEPAGAQEAAAMLGAAAEGIREYGGAGLGDKTMLDALLPAVAALGEHGLQAAARAAIEGARQTRSLLARRGRGAYLGQRTVGLPDPGAVVVAQMLAEVALQAGITAAGLDDLERLNGAVREPAPSIETPVQAAEPPVKSFVNDPQDVPLEALAGLAQAHAGLVAWDPKERIVHRATPQAAGHVGLVSGGGSGHEPLHGGFVGPGMLSAAAPGSIFASPTVGQVLAATRAADRGGGVLQIVKNYTGDVINFKLAAEILAREGRDVTSIVVQDDVATAGAEIGARGTAATLFVEKLAGALAERGAGLAEVRDLAARVARASASIGVALAPCAPPGGSPLFQLGPGEIEIGIGIHGEKGIERQGWKPAGELVAELLDTLLPAVERPGAEPFLLLVNGLGSTPALELYLLYGEARRQLAARGIEIRRSLVGSYVTSLNMAGASFSVLPLTDELVSLWDAPVLTPALRWGA